MARPRYRPRPTANRASRQKQGRRGRPVAEEPPKIERVRPGDAAKEDDASRDAAKAETGTTDSARIRFYCAALIFQDRRGQDRRGDRPASEAAKPAGRAGSARTDPETAKVDAPKESAGSASPIRSGLIRCRRLPLHRQFPQRPRLTPPRATRRCDCTRNASTGDGYGARARPPVRPCRPSRA